MQYCKQGYSKTSTCFAWLVTRFPGFSCPMLLLKSLHCFLCVIALFQDLCNSLSSLIIDTTVYLNSLLTPAINSRQLRSINSNPLYIPRVKTKAGTRAFSVVAPTLWHSLHASVKLEANIVSFCRRRKTHLFNAAYPP